MRKNLFPFALVASLALLSSFCTNHNSIPVTATTSTASEPGFAVVELFTSEGCSSCPAADKAIEELQKQYADNVYVLAFHVDYWNRLGWMDSFSKAEYTQRQNEYATQFNLESIYTPQVVVNGQQEFVGSDKAKLQSATTAGLKNTSSTSASIQLTTEATEGTTITVHYKLANASSDSKLHIALVQNEAATDVKRGENSGRQLHHINIVRDYKTVSASSPEGTVELKLPHTLSMKQVKIIAYQQNSIGVISAVSGKSITAL